jgi:hypothetical protein
MGLSSSGTPEVNWGRRQGVIWTIVYGYKSVMGVYGSIEGRDWDGFE